MWNLQSTMLPVVVKGFLFVCYFRPSWVDLMDDFELKTTKKTDQTEANSEKSKARRKREAKQRRKAARQKVRAV